MTDAAYKIRLENYYGPLDLLLHLVQAHEVDVLQIPIATIADQYVRFIETLQQHDLEMSGDFVALAAHLVLLKSRAVVPPEPGEVDEEVEEDEAPLLELIKKLLEFRKIKDLSGRVGELMDARRVRWGRPRIKVEAPEPDGPGQVELWDLVVAYARLVERTTLRPSMEILYTELPVQEFIERILQLVMEGRDVRFSDVIGAQRDDRGAVIGSFLALLELMKQQQVSADQGEGGAEIVIRPKATS